VEIRTDTSTDYGLRARSSKVSMRKQLPATADELLKSFPTKLRSQIKRAQQGATTVRIGRHEELDAFYRVFSINMRDLGTPVYSRGLFEAVLRNLPESSWICTVCIDGVPVAAGFLVGYRGTLEIPWASSLRQYNKRSPNMLLYWSVLKFAVERGYTTFDFGRSSPDSGTYRFKEQWGAQPVPLFWHYWVKDDGPLPETQMDLVKAQQDYARLLKGADLILMLSSMLHSIGVGNMTPAGVKLVCVDINPAVVTKLSDRGSVESVGVVTDVGLFLNLLTQRLRKLDQKDSS
jgi:FemAB-related protein (PEP-CTERM system-associated)